MKSLPRLQLIISFLLVSGIVLQSCSDQQTARIPQFSEDYQGYVETLSSDEFEGRAPNTAGGEKTKNYLESRFSEIGLSPANNGSYRQAVPLAQITSSNISDLQISGNGASTSFSSPDEMVVGSVLSQESVNIDNSEIIFAGYGVVAPEYDWNDYEGIDVTGKIVIVLVNDPGYWLKDGSLFTGSAMTYYGRWKYKYEEGARQGAAAVLVVHETDPASYGWDVVRNGWTGTRYGMGGEKKDPSLTAQGWIQYETATKIFEQAGLSFEDLKAEALLRDFEATPLGLTASVSFDQKYEQSESHNIIGYVPGSQYPDETIIYMAHWDHLGATETSEGKKIYNGAIDNATGTAALISIAEKFVNMDPPPARNVVFAALTAEESGLIGSAYYALNPLFPLATTAGGINIDGLNVYGPTRDISVIGFGVSDFQDMLAKHAAEQNRILVPEEHPEYGYFYRSDHFNLVKRGVPMIYANSGNDFIGRDEEYAEMVKKDSEGRYHTPEDVINDLWDWSGIDQDLWLFFHVGEELANSRAWPEWYEGTEFKAIRDESREKRTN